MSENKKYTSNTDLRIAEFIDNYISLIQQVNKEDLSTVIRFCSLFQTDDVQLFNKFKESEKELDDIINLYAEKYDLNVQTDMKKITYLFIQNAINNGFSYHMANSANLSSILEIGLLTGSGKIKTEERRDLEKFKQITSPELFNKLEPFHSDLDKDRISYSNIPNLNSRRYGKMPEWIQELELNSSFTDFGNEEVVKDFANEIIKKYHEKYDGQSSIQLILPYLGKKFSEGEIEQLLEEISPKQIISLLYGNLKNNNEYYDKNIPGSSIIAVNPKSLELSVNGKHGEIETIRPQMNLSESSKKTKFSPNSVISNAIASGITPRDEAESRRQQTFTKRNDKGVSKDE